MCLSVQFSSVAQSCPILCDPMDCSTPGLPVYHQLLEFTQTHVHIELMMHYVHAYFVIFLIDNMTNLGCPRLFDDHMQLISNPLRLAFLDLKQNLRFLPELLQVLSFKLKPLSLHIRFLKSYTYVYPIVPASFIEKNMLY